jgi:hypothetical protein
MKRRTKQWMAVVLSAQTLTTGSAAGGLAGGAAGGKVEVVNRAANQPVAVKPGVLKGTILNPADQKPWGRVSVELVDPATGKVLKKARADKQGRYDLGDVEEGKYVIRVNGKIEVPLEVSGSASASVLNIAVPASLMGGALGGAVSWTTIGLAGAGVATAVAVPVGLAGGGGGGSDPKPVSGS